MALLHFAFGGLFRENRIDDQVHKTCELILGPRKLRGGECPEFLPILNDPSSQWAIPHTSLVTSDGGIAFTEYVPAPRIGLLPCDTWMLCFAEMPLTKLAAWPCREHYGQLAIAFTDNFKDRHGIKKVSYYELERLAHDPKVIAYNQSVGSGDVDKLSAELLTLRKPMKQWPEFRRLYGMTRISAGVHDVQRDVITYDRYHDGYDFSKEVEARMQVNREEPFVSFEEIDVFRIFAPSETTKGVISEFLRTNWIKPPPVEVFPVTHQNGHTPRAQGLS